MRAVVKTRSSAMEGMIGQSTQSRRERDGADCRETSLARFVLSDTSHEPEGRSHAALKLTLWASDASLALTGWTVNEDFPGRFICSTSTLMTPRTNEVP